MPQRVAILGTRYPDFSIEEGILGVQGVEIVSGPGSTPDEIAELAGDAAVIIAGSAPGFTREVLGRLRQCRAIVRSGIGVDSVDLVAAAESGFWVINVPDYGTEAVAQHALAMVLAGSRRLNDADRIVKDGGWGFSELRPLHLPGAMTAGIVGFGRIGRRVAELMSAVGFGRVLVCDPLSPPEVAVVPLERLLTESDVVSLHAPPPAGEQPLLGAGQLSRMKPGSILVNTSRGALIDDRALAVALAAGAPRLAALDVFRPEPPDLAVLEPVRDRLLLSPHMAWYTEQSEASLRRQAAEEALRILRGSAPLNRVVEPQETA